jgi:hypothetical protein
MSSVLTTSAPNAPSQNSTGAPPPAYGSGSNSVAAVNPLSSAVFGATAIPATTTTAIVGGFGFGSPVKPVASFAFGATSNLKSCDMSSSNAPSTVVVSQPSFGFGTTTTVAPSFSFGGAGGAQSCKYIKFKNNHSWREFSKKNSKNNYKMSPCHS